MTGYRVVFDREKLVLGWKKFECRSSSSFICILASEITYKSFIYSEHIFAFFTGNDIENSSLPIRRPRATSVPPAVAVGVGNDTKSARDSRNISQSQSSAGSPLFRGHPAELTCLRLFFMLFLLL